MAGPRESVVQALTQAALAGMDTVEGTSGDELVSACFTLTRRMIGVVLEMNPKCRPVIRGAVESLLMDCVDDSMTN